MFGRELGVAESSGKAAATKWEGLQTSRPVAIPHKLIPIRPNIADSSRTPSATTDAALGSDSENFRPAACYPLRGGAGDVLRDPEREDLAGRLPIKSGHAARCVGRQSPVPPLESNVRVSEQELAF